MKDRMVAGGLAGIIAGLVQYAYGASAKALGLTDRFFGQFSDVVFTAKVYTGILGILLSILTHLAVTIMLGIVFAYIIAWTTSRYYLLKGAGYGFVLWFVLSGLGTVTRLPLFREIPEKSALAILAGALIFGLTLGYFLKIIDQKSSLL